MPSIQPDQIAPNVPVRHANSPSKVGVLTGHMMMAPVLMVEVRWANVKEFEPAEVIELFGVDEDDSFEGLVRNNRFEGITNFRSLMSSEKLSGSLSNVVYSMESAELDFFAHQFIPVLKFVNSPLSRLLIADEVGLGKTIEAGLIWTECRARYKARRLLVVCPPTLIPKWIRELGDRFGIDADHCDAAGLLKHFERFEKSESSHEFALVTSYNALRPFKKEKKLLQPWLKDSGGPRTIPDDDSLSEWKPRPKLLRSLLEWDYDPFIDLAVFDEAHMMKNTATANHLVGDVIASSSQSVLALSATPLTTATRDLFSLLHLLDSDMFRDESDYNGLVQRNAPAIRLISELSKDSPNRDECLSLLNSLPDSTARRNLTTHLKGLGSLESVEVSERVEILSKASRLNELGSFLTRTRKTEIPEHKADRTSVVLEVDPTSEERDFYNGCLDLIRKRAAQDGRPINGFHLIMPSLSMTSCLPVMAEALESGNKWGDMEDLASLRSGYSDDSFEGAFVNYEIDPTRDLSWIRRYDFETNDTKYAALRDELLERCKEEKVIIFAFFKATLRYLQRRLEADGLSCLLVTGEIKDKSERDRLLTSFEDPEHRVLLCSEVAAEGVDLQFCRVLVNYDLPWNPMRVEQRIGRIDRIGQKAKTIVIINMRVKGTIDASIFTHLHSNIGIFENTIGDLEPIIGEAISKLGTEILADELTPEAADRQARRVVEAIEREKAVIESIDEETDSLLGLRSFLQDNIRETQSLGRFIKPGELRLYSDSFFEDVYSGGDACILNWDTPAEECLTVKLSFRAISDFEDYIRSTKSQWPRGFPRDQREARLTFDPDVHQEHRKRHRSLILVNHLHPLVRWMVSTRADRDQRWHPAVAVRIQSGGFPEGVWAFGVMRALISHESLSREELVFRAVDIETGAVLSPSDSEALVNLILDHGESWHAPGGFSDASAPLAIVLKHLEGDSAGLRESFDEELELRINSKTRQVRNHFQRRIEIARERLNGMLVDPEGKIRGITLTRNQIQHLEDRLEEEMGKLMAGPDSVKTNLKRIACGLIQNQPPVRKGGQTA
ncbi:helicase-related protein [Verrucomicrobiales bacterium]|nr:helicase-related protein [Verrucomicrobiales bacterium]